MEQLRDIIAAKIKRSGPINFRDFMELALYHPTLGYYNRTHEKIGKLGDYYTAANVSDLFGHTIAGEIKKRRREYDAGELFTLVEFGAGTGQLAADILNDLQKDNGLNLINYIIIEKSAGFIDRQAKKLESFQKTVSWATTEELLANPVRGIVLQNEVIDALAVHRVVVQNKTLKEIYIDYQNEKFVEIVAEPSTQALVEYFGKFGSPLEDGQRAEVNLEALSWIESLSKILASGYIITIDYGGPAAEIYSPTRFGGTLACYFKHEVKDDPYERIGEQDITSHVNFTALIRRGEELGLKKVSFETQANFLIYGGILERLDEIQRSTAVSEVNKVKARLAIKNLIMPQAMGERFRVLIQKK